MSIGKHALSLAAALAIGGALLSLTTGEAEARPRRPQDNGVRCVMEGGWGGDFTFYLPGEDRPGWAGWRCGRNGEWVLAPEPEDDAGGPSEPKGKGKGR